MKTLIVLAFTLLSMGAFAQENIDPDKLSGAMGDHPFLSENWLCKLPDSQDYLYQHFAVSFEDTDKGRISSLSFPSDVGHMSKLQNEDGSYSFMELTDEDKLEMRILSYSQSEMMVFIDTYTVDEVRSDKPGVIWEKVTRPLTIQAKCQAFTNFDHVYHASVMDSTEVEEYYYDVHHERIADTDRKREQDIILE
jgi:hypothetical protein